MLSILPSFFCIAPSLPSATKDLSPFPIPPPYYLRPTILFIGPPNSPGPFGFSWFLKNIPDYVLTTGDLELGIADKREHVVYLSGSELPFF